MRVLGAKIHFQLKPGKGNGPCEKAIKGRKKTGTAYTYSITLRFLIRVTGDYLEVQKIAF